MNKPGNAICVTSRIGWRGMMRRSSRANPAAGKRAILLIGRDPGSSPVQVMAIEGMPVDIKDVT